MPAKHAFVLSSVLALVQVVSLHGEDQKPTLTFQQVVIKHFSKWDANRDGKLSGEELVKRIESPATKGTEAAAVVALYRAWQQATTDKTALPPLTLAGLLEPNDKSVARISSSYVTYWQRMQGARRHLFPEQGPGLKGFHQGKMGDCYFLSTIAMLAHQRPAALRALVRERPGGGFEVKFGNGRHTVVRSVTDAELAIGASAREQGLWPIVMEKAYGQLQAAKVKPGSLPEGAVDRMGHGGDGQWTIEAVTGHKAGFVSIKRLPAAKKASAVHEVLAKSTPRKMVVVAATGMSSKVPPGMSSGHDYGVLDYDVKCRVVQVWNPWGHVYEPKGPAGLKFGYPTQQGRFEIPLNEFVQLFVSLYYETPTLKQEPKK